MCVISNIGDAATGIYTPQAYPWVYDGTVPAVSREEFNDLKEQVEQLKKLLIEAKKFDKLTNQPGCELESKVETLRRVAEAVGVDLEEVFGKPKKKKRNKAVLVERG